MSIQKFVKTKSNPLFIFKPKKKEKTREIEIRKRQNAHNLTPLKNVCNSFTHRISLTLLNIFVVICFVCSISNLVVIDQCWNETAVDLFDKFHNKFYELLCALSSHWHQMFYTVCCALCTDDDIELYWNILCTFLFTFSWFCWCYYFIVCTSTATIHTLRTKGDVINCIWFRCCCFISSFC